MCVYVCLNREIKIRTMQIKLSVHTCKNNLFKRVRNIKCWQRHEEIRSFLNVYNKKENWFILYRK